LCWSHLVGQDASFVSLGRHAHDGVIKELHAVTLVLAQLLGQKLLDELERETRRRQEEEMWDSEQ